MVAPTCNFSIRVSKPASTTKEGGNEHLNTKAKLDMDSEAGDTGLCNDGNDTM